MQKHPGIIPSKRLTDYLAGTIPFENRVSNGDWTPYLPDYDRQKINGLETEACVPFTATQSAEIQINYFLKNNLLPNPTFQWLKLNNYLEYRGPDPATQPSYIIHLSERFTAKLDGTTLTGTSMTASWDAIRKIGAIPFSDWPYDDTITTWDQFYAPIPQPLLDKGKLFLTYFATQYEWIVNGLSKGTDIQDMQKHLQHAPLCIGAPVCEPWDQNQPPVCPDTTPAHATTAYKIDTLTHILDHYDPFLKMLDFSYNIPFVLKALVNFTSPTPPPLPTYIAPTSQNVSILQKIATFYQAIIALIKGRNS